MPLELDGDVLTAARSILGATLRYGGVVVRITEVEAYDGPNDPASHAARGRTPRTGTMFGPPGRLYVYFSYGNHWAANVVCGPAGTASGVLLRSGEVIEGIEVARSRRGAAPDRDLARGPGRLCQALGITGELKGADVLNGKLIMLRPAGQPPAGITSGPRVGVSKAADRPWRFWIEGDRFVSDYRRSPRAVPTTLPTAAES